MSNFGKQKHRVLLQKSWEREPKGSREDAALSVKYKYALKSQRKVQRGWPLNS